MSSSHKTEFTYSQLKQPHSIRLLRLTRPPDPQDTGSHLRCVIEHYLLGDEQKCPEYAAISYCWGDPKNVVPVTVNGAQAAITVNLEAALRQLLKDNLADETYLWADALCINQDDVREKTRQIELMPKIYAGATKVITWLSQEDRDAEHLAYLSVVLLKNPNRRKDQAAFLRAVNALSTKSYWSRIWIVQELSLAKHVEVVCKGQRVPWHKFVQLSCSHMGLPMSPGSAGAASDILSDSRIIELNAIRQEVQNEVPMPILRALYRTRACQSTIKADRVFALLGLTSDGTSKISKLKYTDEHRITLLNLTLAEMEETGRLDLITFPDRRDTASYNIRTWSPNWINRALWRRLRVWQLHQILQTPGDYFRATPPSIHHKFDFKRAELKVIGYPLGSISALDAPTRLKYRHPSSLSAAVDTLITEFPDSPGNEAFDWILKTDSLGVRPTSSSISSSVSSISLEDPPGSPGGPKNQSFMSVRMTNSALYRSRLQSLLEFLEPLTLRRRVSSNDWLIFQDSAGEEETAMGDNPGTRTWIPRDPVKFRSIDAQYATELRALLYLGSSYTTQTSGELAITDMRFAGTSSGLVGLVHIAAQPGDQVYLIEGCSAPVVLRERKFAPGCYEVVGEALVLGVMKGEFFEKKKKKGQAMLGPGFRKSEKDHLLLI